MDKDELLWEWIGKFHRDNERSPTHDETRAYLKQLKDDKDS